MRFVTLAAVGLLLLATMPAQAQMQGLPQPGAPAGASPVCQRLEGQLAVIDRGGGDAARNDQVRRYEEAANRQQAELERVTAQARRMGCDSSGFFSLFSGQSAQCGPVNTQIQQMRGNLDQITSSLERLRNGGGSDRESQRRSVLAALAQSNCGPQYAAAARSSQGGGFLNDLFGGPAGNTPSVDAGPPASTFRTVCVRTCDGFYFPISFATVPGRFGDDERACKSLCPASEATLFTYRNPGEDMNQAVSISGQSYSALPNAFKYRQEFNPSCACKGQGQNWAEALKTIDDRSAAQKGDIVVTEERAKQMAQPRDAQGRPVRPAQPAPASAPPAAVADQPAATAPADGTAATRPIRSVGPTGPAFVPAR